MENQKDLKVSKLYLASVLLFMLILPVVSIIINSGGQNPFSILLVGKWFVFWGIGARLFTAGLKQVIQPGFTALDIFHIDDKRSHVIVRELGFANICFGLAGLLSLIIPSWQTAAAFIGGLYMGIAGIQHIIRKPTNPTEIIAMVSDLWIFSIMAVYLGVTMIGVMLVIIALTYLSDKSTQQILFKRWQNPAVAGLFIGISQLNYFTFMVSRAKKR